MSIVITTIQKRDGRVLEFAPEKIKGAVTKAFEATKTTCTEERVDKIVSDVASALENKLDGATPTVEQIQDMVEQVLINHGYIRTAKAYILYRAERTRIREMNTRLMRIYEDITFKDAKESNIKRENANIDGNTAMGMMLKYGSEGSKQFYEMFVMRPDFAKAHAEGDIHIHDMDFYGMTTTCCQIDLLTLFKDGFSTGHGVLREPNDIASYSALACIAIQSNQNDQHGGQSIVNFDYSLAEGVKKTFVKRYRKQLDCALALICGDETVDLKAIWKQVDASGCKLRIADSEEYLNAEKAALEEAGIADKDVLKAQQFSMKKALEETDTATFQAMEAFIHNLNTMHSRAGAQTPFSSINYGMDTSAEG
ncbi:MAG: anaerobic ribonucleoside-triphosphate reductase, partial [Clostridia bacterium]